MTFKQLVNKALKVLSMDHTEPFPPYEVFKSQLQKERDSFIRDIDEWIAQDKRTQLSATDIQYMWSDFAQWRANKVHK